MRSKTIDNKDKIIRKMNVGLSLVKVIFKGLFTLIEFEIGLFWKIFLTKNR